MMTVCLSAHWMLLLDAVVGAVELFLSCCLPMLLTQQA
jgi:hypothetical protein